MWKKVNKMRVRTTKTSSKCVLKLFLILTFAVFVPIMLPSLRKGNTRIVDKRSTMQDVMKDIKLELKKPLFVPIKTKEMQNKVFSIAKFPFLNFTSFSLEPLTDCTNLQLIALIHSSPYHFERRETIRRTWTNQSYFSVFGPVKRIFLFGTVDNDKLQKAISTEHHIYGDILQGNFIDNYYNLSFNTMTGLKWIINRCDNVQTVMKVDDDIVIDMFRFLNNTVLSLVHKSRQVFCRYSRGKIFRNSKSKWYLPDSIFAGETKYPSYCEGKLVLMTFDIIPSLYSVALNTPYFFIEDVFMYGLVINKIEGVSFLQLKWGSDMMLNGSAARTCLMKKKHNCSVYVAGVSSDEEMEELWFLFRQKFMLNHLFN
ncbi:beta-1,3-galactosyltransferase 5-like [Mercenaria mercenaria]|uniref:beta-1,3-galactosyltransferase 5-like n=1 Tax=Mercenaria mercenaria TaxID=6596 RepID=UPI001E1D7C41|nr:beta-1,3-galactosyltransferase 5-like [Mercenaria mercenaria]